jgi:hypothetical protein
MSVNAATAFLGELCNDDLTKPWMISVIVDETPFEFKIDTGADATVLPELLYRKQISKPLVTTVTKIRNAAVTDIRVLGKFEARLSTVNTSSPQEVNLRN